MKSTDLNIVDIYNLLVCPATRARQRCYVFFRNLQQTQHTPHATLPTAIIITLQHTPSTTISKAPRPMLLRWLIHFLVERATSLQFLRSPHYSPASLLRIEYFIGSIIREADHHNRNSPSRNDGALLGVASDTFDAVLVMFSGACVAHYERSHRLRITQGTRNTIVYPEQLKVVFVTRDQLARDYDCDNGNSKRLNETVRALPGATTKVAVLVCERVQMVDVDMTDQDLQREPRYVYWSKEYLKLWRENFFDRMNSQVLEF